MFALAGPLDDLLGLPAALTRAVGAFLPVHAALVWAVGARPAAPRRGVLAVVAGNAAWAIDSLAFAAAQHRTRPEPRPASAPGAARS